MEAPRAWTLAPIEQDSYQQRIKELRSLVHEVYRQASEAGQEACCQRAPIPAGGEADHQDLSHGHGNGRLALNGFCVRFACVACPELKTLLIGRPPCASKFGQSLLAGQFGKVPEVRG